ncbi:MAG TPA: hypothetical protein VMU88_11280 [bacterium]|nr:hypothetical protein [bacterium]
MPRNKVWAALGPALLLAAPLFAAPFQPSWTGELSAGYSAEEGGQEGFSLSFTGLKRLTPQGSFFFAKAFSRTLKVEKAQAASAGFETGGGLGLGDFTPFLLLEMESGDSRFNAIRVNVGADKDLSPSLALDFSLVGEVTSHQGPLGAYVGLPAGSAAEVDDLNARGGATLRWKLSGAFSLSGGLQFNSYETVKIQDPAHQVFNEVDSAESAESLSLRADWSPAEELGLWAAVQGGLDSTPAGTFYSERQAQTLTQASAQSRAVADFSLGTSWRF